MLKFEVQVVLDLFVSFCVRAWEIYTISGIQMNLDLEQWEFHGISR